MNKLLMLLLMLFQFIALYAAIALIVWDMIPWDWSSKVEFFFMCFVFNFTWLIADVLVETGWRNKK